MHQEGVIRSEALDQKLGHVDWRISSELLTSGKNQTNSNAEERGHAPPKQMDNSDGLATNKTTVRAVNGHLMNALALLECLPVTGIAAYQHNPTAAPIHFTRGLNPPIQYIKLNLPENLLARDSVYDRCHLQGLCTCGPTSESSSESVRKQSLRMPTARIEIIYDTILWIHISHLATQISFQQDPRYSELGAASQISSAIP
eukprot:gene10313-8244_t